MMTRVETLERTIQLLQNALDEALGWNWLDDDAPAKLGPFLHALASNTNGILDDPDKALDEFSFYTHPDNL
jgi:hypothetical protein